ncbi:OsmC family peroxiredoxin [Lactococcus taiwanensis]|uniref:OsmC family peroxiredoxin n=1 Tax=Lactococcus taiwanensis TaxID=1151742 RepID=UPI0007B2D7A4|nr:OsmC family peroxiredoxin [Lactococcus taiwanensis]KZK36571.1 Osmotically inducible protein C [Lactococcus cremoris]QRZ10696.1 OsmC family peroxiredoxin [Lactococcus taiwanensis]
MANTSVASAHWEDSLEEGFGTISAESSQLFTEAPYNFKARAESQVHITTPEELLGAAHAACFSQALALFLGEKKLVAKSIDTTAEVTFDVVDGAPTVAKIHLKNVSDIPGLSQADFAEIAEYTKNNCPVSRALAGVQEISLEAHLA